MEEKKGKRSIPFSVIITGASSGGSSEHTRHVHKWLLKQGSPELLLQSRKLQVLVVQLPLENGGRFPQGCFQFPPPRVLSAST